MGQGRGREDATADSSVGAKGPDCVDTRRRENQRRDRKRERTYRARKILSQRDVRVIIDGLSW